MNRLSNIELRPGDIFFVDGADVLGNVIELCQRPFGPWARWSHVGVILGDDGWILETTSWRTALRSLPANYAGSRIKVLRWAPMTKAMAMRGLGFVSGQQGRIYPYWRLLTHLLRVQAYLHGTSMECSVLTAAFLMASGFPLARTHWWYAPRSLHDEMEAQGCDTVFNGRLREAGCIGEV